MNKEDILRAARGHALEKHYFYLIEVNNGSPVLLEKRPRSGKDIVLNIVLTKFDDEFTKTPQYDAFFEECKRAPCCGMAVARSPDGQSEKDLQK